jgi:hypothetical protein
MRRNAAQAEGHKRHVCFTPKADIATLSFCTFQPLISAPLYSGRAANEIVRHYCDVGWR